MFPLPFSGLPPCSLLSVFGVPPPDFCSPTLDFCQSHTVARPRLTVLFLPVLLYPSEHIQRENSVVTGLQQNAKGNQYWVTSARLRLRHALPLLHHPLATCRPFVPFVMRCLRPIAPPSLHRLCRIVPSSHVASIASPFACCIATLQHLVRACCVVPFMCTFAARALFATHPRGGYQLRLAGVGLITSLCTS
jgi:hypothetical protein